MKTIASMSPEWLTSTVPQHDFARVDAVPGSDMLTQRDRAIIAEFAASMPTAAPRITRRVSCMRKREYHGEAPGPGKPASPTYRTWLMMINRCHNPNATNYSDYGARGIKVCKRWRSSYLAFIADMGERPSLAHSIDRMKNLRGYTPSNCRWATRKEQAQNRRSTLLLTFAGKTKPLIEWSRIKGVPYGTLYDRIYVQKHRLSEVFS